ncbi:hypothetical protein [Yoonia sediminilitoris]|uniref:Uncharacterized protein n=1 Tax=Yoonia sediminilitoris TaxID=1286148 RepID=A0A2T6KRK2_9RHOB|nr:hypothetical protein [Yoonia sediminilitoris]PUB19188.1 hypothetical protein C8N45_101781 [Yoonia sediminilitoris]RCW99356.1 hypothetical protein DFP92_101781 [Yoonia sediminilitoris]
MTKDPRDPKGLIREAYLIDGITAAECRSIFLDWALGVPVEKDTQAQVRALLLDYAEQPNDHPMTQTLLAALHDAPPPRRRGGRAGRLGTES